MIADVIINTTAKSLHQCFSYIVPDHLDVRIGSRVAVPFGPRTAEGIVVALSPGDGSQLGFDVRPVSAVLTCHAGFQEEMIETARWISEYYLCTMADALRLFMVEKQGLKRQYWAVPGEQAAPAGSEEAAAVDCVRRLGSMERSRLVQKFGASLVEQLAAHGYIHWEQRMKNAVADKRERWLVFRHDDDAKLLARRPRQAALLQALKEKGSAPEAAFVAQGFSRDLMSRLCATGLAVMEERLARTSQLLPSLESGQAVTLTAEQQYVIQQVQADTEGRTYVLHGITGSGKTEVYMQLTAQVLAQGKQVIVLVPEIALTGQIVRQFIRRFGDQVVVMHSQLSKGERRNNGLRMLYGESSICIGARSAVFTAAQSLGLIIVDEAHDSSYKQDEAPRYRAVDVARRRAAYYGCPVILGSATPSVSDYYRALHGEYVLLEMTRRVGNRPLPDVQVVDMREELARGNYRVASDAMVALISQALQEGNQAIVLLNRRGFSTFVMCRKCGYVVKCRKCDVPMVYHKQGSCLRCHYCGAEEEIPTVCPSCGSKYIKFFGTGTEKAEEQLRELFPNSRIIRLDQDTTSRKNSGDRIIESFRRHDYDILLGTQMVAKGHDFPAVSAVAILSADSLLNLPAYWAGERTFQLLTQAAGRAGRGDTPGRVVMQTYAPDHYVIQCAQRQDYRAFYDQEIQFRQAFLYPPFHYLLKILVTGEDEQALWQKGNDLAQRLRQWVQQTGSAVEIVGPYADIIARIRGKYRLVILLKGCSLEEVKQYIFHDSLFWERGVIMDVDPAF